MPLDPKRLLRDAKKAQTTRPATMVGRETTGVTRAVRAALPTIRRLRVAGVSWAAIAQALNLSPQEVAFLISAPCFILAMNSPWLIGLVLPGGGSHTQQLVLAFLIFLIPTGLNLAWLGPITAAVQHLAPAPMRSTASAMFSSASGLALPAE